MTCTAFRRSEENSIATQIVSSSIILVNGGTRQRNVRAVHASIVTVRALIDEGLETGVDIGVFGTCEAVETNNSVLVLIL
jgi:hypothetical protein